MKILLLLCFIPSLIAADILCSDSKTTCPENKQCCEVDGKHSCCDPAADEDVPESRMKVFPGTEIMSSVMSVNASFPGNESRMDSTYCNFLTCDGTCCAGDYCCAGIASDCCGNLKCCPTLNKCCSSGCCGFDQICCDGWCCLKGSRCGPRYMTCRSKGVTVSPEIITMLLLVTSVFVSRRL